MTFSSLPRLPLALSLLSLFIFYYICINSSLFGKAISISVSIWCIFGSLRLVSGFRFFHAVLRQLRSCAVHSMLRFSTSNSSKRHFEISIIMSCSFDIELASCEANKQRTTNWFQLGKFTAICLHLKLVWRFANSKHWQSDISWAMCMCLCVWKLFVPTVYLPID